MRPAKLEVHRLTANHDYGSFHVETNKPDPIMIERSSFSTSNASYGNFIPWAGAGAISLLRTPDAMRRIGQKFNFQNRDTTSKEIGVFYEGYDPLDTSGQNENEQFSLRQALMIRQRELARKDKLPHYHPSELVAPSPYKPSPTENIAPRRLSRPAKTGTLLAMTSNHDQKFLSADQVTPRRELFVPSVAHDHKDTGNTGHDRPFVPTFRHDHNDIGKEMAAGQGRPFVPTFRHDHNETPIDANSPSHGHPFVPTFSHDHLNSPVKDSRRKDRNKEVAIESNRPFVPSFRHDHGETSKEGNGRPFVPTFSHDHINSPVKDGRRGQQLFVPSVHEEGGGHKSPRHGESFVPSVKNEQKSFAASNKESIRVSLAMS